MRPLAAAFFARQDFKTPVRTAVMALVVTQCLNAVFIWGLDLAHAGLALSVGLAACANSAVLFWVLRRRGWYRFEQLNGRFMLQLSVALVAMVLALWVLRRPDEFWLTADLSARVLHLSLSLTAAVAVYFAALRLGGLRFSDFRLKI